MVLKSDLNAIEKDMDIMLIAFKIALNSSKWHFKTSCGENNEF